MADRTGIEWTDATWNPVTGCSLASPGCRRCYAMKLAGTRMQHHPSRAGLTIMSEAGPVWTGQVRFNDGSNGTPDWLGLPLHWARPRKIFVCAHGDLFHESVPDAWINKVFAVMALAPQHIFQVLTKRARRMREYVLTPGRHPSILACAAEIGGRDIIISRGVGWPWPLPNIWLGVSAETQHWLMQRATHLVETPAAVRFLSYEPALGQLDLQPFLHPARQWSTAWHNNYPFWAPKHQLNWVICGGENGDRPMHPDWARSARDQCAAADVPFFFKQWGSWAPIDHMSEEQLDACYRPRSAHRPLAVRRSKVEQLILHADQRRFPVDEWSRISGENPAAGDFAFAQGKHAMTMMKIGKASAGRMLDGRTHDDFPTSAVTAEAAHA